MTIKQQGGVFGRNPTFNDVTIEGDLEIDGTLKFDGDIDINSDLKVNGDLEVLGQSALGATIPSDAHATWSQYFVGEKGSVISEKLNAGGLFGMWLTDNVYIDNDTGNVAYLTTDEASAVRCEAGEIRFSSAPSGTAGAAMTLTQYAKFTTAGNLAFVSGKGIDFSATSGTGTSELLDDYEEGEWTPSVSAGAISGTSITYTGNYTKIGNTVTVWFRAENTAGDIQISSYAVLGTLPFTAAIEGTGTVTTEDIDEFSRQGFASVSGTTLALSASGSATGTVKLSCSVTYKV
jgi:hypothetical protein